MNEIKYFTYTKKSYEQTKAFHYLINILSLTNDNLTIVVNKTQDIIELNEILKEKKINNNKLLIITLNSLIDDHFQYTFNSYKQFLTSLFYSYLHSKKRTNTEHILLKNEQLQLDFLESMLHSQKINKFQSLELFNETPEKKFYWIYENFKMYCYQKFHLKLDLFYEKQKKLITQKKQNQYFFININIDEPWKQRATEKIINKYKESTWILNKNQELTISWLVKSLKPKNEMHEEGDEKKIQVTSYPNHQKEITDILSKINKISKQSKDRNILIIPSNEAYKTELLKQLTLNKQQYTLNDEQNTLSKNVVKSIRQYLTFCSQPFTVNSCLELANSPWFNEIDNENIHLLLLKSYLNKHKDLQNKSIKDIQKHLEDNEKDIHYKSKIFKELDIYIIFRKIHTKLRATENVDQWFDTFQHQLLSLSLINKEENNVIKDILKTIIDFIGQQVLYIKKTKNRKHIEQILKNQLNLYYFFKSSPTNSALQIYTLNTVLLIQKANYFVIGADESLLEEPKKESINATKDKEKNYKLSNRFTELINRIPLVKISYAKCINGENKKAMATVQVKKRSKNIDTKKIMSVKKRSIKITSTQTKLKEISVTKLTQYQQCPYKYWLKYVLKLDPIETLKEDIAATEWGTLLHHILEQINKTLINKTQPQIADNWIKEIAEEEFKQKPKTFFWNLKKNKFFGTSNVDGIIKDLLFMYKNQIVLAKPIEAEKKFTLSISNTIIKGSIDCVFETEWGRVVVDYKTSKKTPTARDTEKLRHLQLPLYILGDSKDKDTFTQAAMYLQLIDNQKSGIYINSCTKEIKPQIIENKRKRPYIYSKTFLDKIKHHIATLIKLIELKQYQANKIDFLEDIYKQRKTLCQTCEYKLSCRHNKE